MVVVVDLLDSRAGLFNEETDRESSTREEQELTKFKLEVTDELWLCIIHFTCCTRGTAVVPIP